LLPFVEMWEQHSVSFLQWGAPIHTGIIKCFGSNVQLILAGVLRPTSRSSLGCTEVMRGGMVTASDYQTATEKVFRSVQRASHRQPTQD